MERLPEEEFLCPPGVIRELEKYDDPRVNILLANISDCTNRSLMKVK